jgi:hypothetical protein
MPVVSRNVALVGAAEAGRYDALAAQARLAGGGDRSLQVLQGLGDRAVDVFLVVRLRGREEEVRLLEAIAQLESVLESLAVRDQHGVGHALAWLEPTEHLGAVRQLGDYVRPHERGHLDPLELRIGQHADEPQLLLGGNHLGLVLEAVARPHLADADAVGQCLCHRPQPSRAV